MALQLGLTQLMGQASQRAAEQLQLGQWKLQRLMDAVKALSDGGFHGHGGYPIAGWFLLGKIPQTVWPH